VKPDRELGEAGCGSFFAVDIFDVDVAAEENIERSENGDFANDELFTQNRPFAFLGCEFVEYKSKLDCSPADVVLYRSIVSELS
jgi:hypothetical protein